MIVVHTALKITTMINDLKPITFGFKATLLIVGRTSGFAIWLCSNSFVEVFDVYEVEALSIMTLMVYIVAISNRKMPRYLNVGNCPLERF